MNGQNSDGEDLELGEPIRELRELTLEKRVSFFTGIRKKVYRRTTASHLAGFAFHVPKAIAIEGMRMMIEILNTLGKRKGK